jgi:hypothetical protein
LPAGFALAAGAAEEAGLPLIAGAADGIALGAAEGIAGAADGIALGAAEGIAGVEGAEASGISILGASTAGVGAPQA